MSSPNTAFDGCSRLSAHLAWGSISMREVVQATRLRRDRIRASPAGEGRGWLGALSAFEGRLHWHCHFMQKLESEPELEFSNLHRACDGLRENEFDPERLAAWSNGETGFPLVDACMRALKAGGWINFRMRAMLVSFSSYQLWLHWREPALVLARLFTDYEPGIHYSQVQMQSGTTGINTLRIYNPVKQSEDQDPEGRFIRRWIPELDRVPSEWIHTPWLMPADEQRQSHCVIGSQYPAPIVDHLAAAREARGRIQAARRSPEARDEGRQILKTHGSRRRAPRRGAVVANPLLPNRTGSDHEGTSQAAPPHQDLRELRAAVRLAPPLGELLGSGALLLQGLCQAQEGSDMSLRRLVIILGDQLDPASAAFDGFDPERDLVWMAELPEESTHVWSHKARITYFLSAMRHFAETLEARAIPLRYLRLGEHPHIRVSRRRCWRRSRPLVPSNWLWSSPETTGR